MKKLSLFIFFSFICFAAEKQGKYDYHPDSVLSLGGGFNPESLFNGYLSCIEYEGTVNTDGDGAGDMEYVSELITSRKELMTHLGISSKISAQGLFISGDAGINYLNNFSYLDNSLTLMIMAKVSFGRTSLPQKISLSPEYKKLLEDGKHAEFKERCGTHFVNSVKSGAFMFALIRAQDVTEKTRSEFEAHANLKVGGIVGGGTDNRFNSTLNNLAQSGSITVRIYANGGAGVMALENIIIDRELSIKDITTQIHKYMKTMTVERARPISYQTKSMSLLGYKPIGDLNYDPRDEALVDLFHKIERAKSTLDNIKAALSNKGDEYRLPCQEAVDYYKNMRRIFEGKIREWKEIASKCIADPDSECIVKDVKFPEVLVPIYESDHHNDRAITKSFCKNMDNKLSVTQISRKECLQLQMRGLKECVNQSLLKELKILNSAPICAENEMVAWIPCQKTYEVEGFCDEDY